MRGRRHKEPLETEFVTSLEAAQILGITRQTLYKEIAKGTIPALRIGFVHKIPKSFFESYKNNK